MPDIIQLLPDHVANQIAAGEVVQRPASVVKELLENAIDAKATIIKLLIKDAGKTLIQVIDNGLGMTETDARLSFERHATSKIRKAEDLFQLDTKGFRGEALASIAAIAQVELRTKKDNAGIGTKILIEGSDIKQQEPVATPTGTSIAVRNLFYNIPARRNFLKSDKVETRHIIDELQRVALAHENITFYLYNNDNELYHLPASNLKQRIVSIFGKKTNEKLVPIQEQTDYLKIKGFIAKPEYAKKRRGEQFFFVNNRFIKSAYLNHAVKSAFEGLISNSHFPTYFIFLDVPPASIDINIHPTKTEIKFENEKDLYALIRVTVKHSLGQYNVAPILDFNRDSSMDLSYNKIKSMPTSNPKVQVDRNFNPFSNKSKPSWDALYAGGNQTTEQQETESKLTFEQEINDQELFDSNETESTTITQQIHKKYIVSNIKSGMVFIHQNRAHQRILYEKYLSELTVGEIASQQLMFPISIALDTPDLLLFKEIQTDLENSGFNFDAVSNEKIVITAAPSVIDEVQITTIIEKVITAQKEEIAQQNFSYFDYFAKVLAKETAIKVGESLTTIEQEEVLHTLFSCKEPMLSPYNKPTYTTLTINDIDNRL